MLTRGVPPGADTAVRRALPGRGEEDGDGGADGHGGWRHDT